MNTELFTGRAEAYEHGRPGYPVSVLDYIKNLVPQNAVIAEVGAGTGKFTELLAKGGFTLYAIEPNADMRKFLVTVLAPYRM
ncbi:MAG: class I SAM-dependent methyltransferase [Treponema sp.]|nr:class I SAM-dependent methyltransferase [Treponema sp.]